MENEKNIEISEVIDLNNKEQVNYWPYRLDITKVQLKAAVNAVGTNSNDIINYINKKNECKGVKVNYY